MSAPTTDSYYLGILRAIRHKLPVGAALLPALDVGTRRGRAVIVHRQTGHVIREDRNGASLSQRSLRIHASGLLSVLRRAAGEAER